MKQYLRNLAGALIGRTTTEAPKDTWTSADSGRRVRKMQESDRGEDYGYTNLIGGSWRRDLSMSQYDRHLRICADLWRENPVAKKGVQNFRAFVAAEGFQVRSTCKDPEKRAILQARLDEHFRLANWKFKGGQRIETLAVEGEWNYAVTDPCPHTGHIRICKINPEDIKGIKPDPMDAETMVCATLNKKRIETVSDAAGNTKEVEFEELPLVRRCVRTGRLVGKLLHLPINQLTGQTRGWSDIMVVADYVDSLDLLVVGEVDRHRLMKVFSWFVKIIGADPKTYAKRKEELQKDGPPQSGDLLIGDGTEEWTTVTPSLNLQESVLFCEFLLMLIFGGLNMPQHWYSQGGDVNKATAGEMGTPVMAQVRARKELVMEFQLWEHELALFTLLDQGKLPPEIVAADLTIEVISRDPERSSYLQVGQMLTELSVALAAAVTNKWITNLDASKKFRQAAEALGLGEFQEVAELPPGASLKQAQAAITEALTRGHIEAQKPENQRFLRHTNEEFAALW